MILSMTGFGDAVAEHDDAHYAVEIRSLNNRYFKPTIKLPDVVGALEPEIEVLLRKRVGRGSVVYSLKMKDREAEASATIDTAVLRQYIGQLNASGFDVREPERLLFLPGVVVPALEDDEADILSRHRQTILALTEQAVDKLMQMRAREGKALLEDLLCHTAAMARHLDGIRTRAGSVVSQYHDRLTTRVNELLAKAQLKVSEPDLLKEVAVFAERSDISEEIQRLSHHVEQFEQTCRGQDGEHVGRKLDFIAQEMLREANTIGSKANDAEIAGHIVNIKGLIDRVKEQVQNVE